VVLSHVPTIDVVVLFGLAAEVVIAGEGDGVVGAGVVV